MSVTRLFVEKKPGFDVEAKHIQTDLTENLWYAFGDVALYRHPE